MPTDPKKSAVDRLEREAQEARRVFSYLVYSVFGMPPTSQMSPLRDSECAIELAIKSLADLAREYEMALREIIGETRERTWCPTCKAWVHRSCGSGSEWCPTCKKDTPENPADRYEEIARSALSPRRPDVIGPECGTDKWKDQVDRIGKCLRFATTKKELEGLSMMYILDPEYSRSAITQAMDDIEIERGWHV